MMLHLRVDGEWIRVHVGAENESRRSVEEGDEEFNGVMDAMGNVPNSNIAADQTLLAAAIRSGNVELFRHILNMLPQSDIHEVVIRQHQAGHSILHQVIQHGDSELIQHFLNMLPQSDLNMHPSAIKVTYYNHHRWPEKSVTLSE